VFRTPTIKDTIYTAVPANIQLQKALMNVSCHFVVAKKPSLLTNQRGDSDIPGTTRGISLNPVRVIARLSRCLNVRIVDDDVAATGSVAVVGYDGRVAGMFVADDYNGTFTFNNVVFQGGPFGLRLNADDKDLSVALKDVYFVGPFEYRQDARLRLN